MATSKAPPANSLRDRQKNETRRILRATALKLFAAQGYDATRTEEIAEKAGVSTRTFFRYFPTKESVLFAGGRDWIQGFVDEYPGLPGSLSDIDAMRTMFINHAPRLAQRRQALLVVDRVVASSTALRGRVLDHQREDIAALAEGIAARRGLPHADEGCTLLAAIGLLTYRRALDTWLARTASTDLGEAILEEFRLLQAQFPRG